MNVKTVSRYYLVPSFFLLFVIIIFLFHRNSSNINSIDKNGAEQTRKYFPQIKTNEGDKTVPELLKSITIKIGVSLYSIFNHIVNYCYYD